VSLRVMAVGNVMSVRSKGGHNEVQFSRKSTLLTGLPENPRLLRYHSGCSAMLTLGPGVYSASTINDYQKQKMFLWSKARTVHKANNLTAICELIV
jgi:hypothetical protein